MQETSGVDQPGIIWILQIYVCVLQDEQFKFRGTIYLCIWQHDKFEIWIVNCPELEIAKFVCTLAGLNRAKLFLDLAGLDISNMYVLSGCWLSGDAVKNQ